MDFLRKPYKIGGSFGVVIPKDLLQLLNFTEGDNLTFHVNQNNVITLKNAENPSTTKDL